MTAKKDEALKLALEALVDARVRPPHKQDSSKYEHAITAIREALAEQPAQQEQGDSNCQDADGCPTEMAVLQRFWRGEPIPAEHYPVWFKPAQQQEPVGEVFGYYERGFTEQKTLYGKLHNQDLPVGAKLYTSPPASKPPTASRRTHDPV